MIYIGTKLSPDEHHAFRVRAAQSGESLSEALKRLALEFTASKPPAKPPRLLPRPSKKGAKA